MARKRKIVTETETEVVKQEAEPVTEEKAEAGKEAEAETAEAAAPETVYIVREESGAWKYAGKDEYEKIRAEHPGRAARRVWRDGKYVDPDRKNNDHWDYRGAGTDGTERRKETGKFKDTAFFIPLKRIPTATAQQKGEKVVRGKIVHYDRAEVAEAKELFLSHLLVRKPDVPAPKGTPLMLSVKFYFPETWNPEKAKDEKARKIRRRTKKPDCDNLVKTFQDCMGMAGFFADDAQISSLHVGKYDVNTAYVPADGEKPLIPGISVGLLAIGGNEEEGGTEK